MKGIDISIHSLNLHTIMFTPELKTISVYYYTLSSCKLHRKIDYFLFNIRQNTILTLFCVFTKRFPYPILLTQHTTDIFIAKEPCRIFFSCMVLLFK